MDKIEEIKKLKSLLDQGAITLDEFNILKTNVLASSTRQIISETTKPYSAKFPVNSNKQSAKSLPVVRLAFIIIASGFFIYLAFWQSERTSSQSNGSSNVEQDKRIVCNRCNGTGIEVCTLCGGTGKNNLGWTCGCVTLYENTIMMGHTPIHPPLQWTCTKCKGTGYSKY